MLLSVAEDDTMNFNQWKPTDVVEKRWRRDYCDHISLCGSFNQYLCEASYETNSLRAE